MTGHCVATTVHSVICAGQDVSEIGHWVLIRGQVVASGVVRQAVGRAGKMVGQGQMTVAETSGHWVCVWGHAVSVCGHPVNTCGHRVGKGGQVVGCTGQTVTFAGQVVF